MTNTLDMTDKELPRPTDEQIAIRDAVRDGNGSIMIKSYAGCTKTTSLQIAAPCVKGFALATSFSRKTVEELGKKMPQNFKAQSLNGLGHGAWLRRIDKPNMRPDTEKLSKLMSIVLKDRKLELLSDQWSQIRQGVTDAMKAGLSPNNEGNPLTEDTPENWRNILEDASSDEFDIIHYAAREVLIESINLAKAGQISFDDQVYCPTILGGNWPRYPTIFADEAQDLSPLNHRMLELCSIGRIVVVGDPKQAIYKFRGADAQSMDTMRSMKPQWTDLALTLTFRCPKAIVERQQAHAPGYRAFEGNPAGRIFYPESEIESSPVETGWNWGQIKQTADTIAAKQIAVLCRNNAPILSLAFKLIANGVGCVVLGRDIGKGLVRLTQKLAKADNLPIVKFSVILTDWLEKEVALAIANKNDARVDKITDQVEAIRAVVEGAHPSTVGDLRSTLERMFSRENGQVILSTIHKAKGLEWPYVVHLDSWRIPSKQARMAASCGDDSHMQQEHNLRYVCETRSQHTLAFGDLERFSP